MPYGVAKARDGDPYTWVAQNLESHLRGGGIVGGNPDEDYSLERESVGDYADEYQDDLSGILKHAGVPAKETPAPNYETGDLEESTSHIGDTVECPGGVKGKIIADLGNKWLVKDLHAETEDDELEFNKSDCSASTTDEGIIGSLAGGAIGAMTPVPGGALIGSLAGDAIQDKLSDEEKTDEDKSPLAGKYGHSGKMKEVSKDLSFLDRLKELSGMKK